MPTAAKLIGAILFAGLTWMVSDLVRDDLPANRPDGWFVPVNVMVGAILGWTILGRGTGAGPLSAVGQGLATLFATAFWCLVIWSGWRMLERATRLRYDGPVDALEDMVSLMIDHARLLLAPPVGVPALTGAAICGLLTGLAARR